MKNVVKVRVKNEDCKYGIVIDCSEDAWLIKVAKKDDSWDWLGDPHYRLYGKNFLKK